MNAKLLRLGDWPSDLKNSSQKKMVLLQLFRTPRYSLKSSKCNSC